MNKWKVLIADDEPKIRRGLTAMLAEIGSHLEVVAEVEDGQAALDTAIRLKPDLLLLDIRMPVMNGLELIDRLQAISVDWIIVIITGHDEFSYAHQALKLKVFDYLLKPVSQEALATILDSAQSELALRRNNDKYLEWSRQQLEENLPGLRENFLRSLVKGSWAESEIAENLEFLSMKISGPLSLMLFHLIERQATFGHARFANRRLLALTLRAIVSEKIQDTLHPDHDSARLGVWRHDPKRTALPLVFEDDQETVVALLPVQELKTLQAIQIAVEQAASESIHHVPVTACVTDVPGLGELGEYYDDLSAELRERHHHESFVNLVQNYLNAHYQQPSLTLEQVAQEIQLSPAYLSRILKQKTGASFIEYLTRFRINRAVQLLGDPTVRMFEVAQKVGYHSQHYFSRAFRKVLGTSPSEYRKGGAE